MASLALVPADPANGNPAVPISAVAIDVLERGLSAVAGDLEHVDDKAA